MSVRVAFEVGHSATVKGKTTVEGFTHDWELFVRGIDSNSNIHRFVDKVVFNLHESFPKPKRVFKDPPYSLKECGYAGFELDIDIYFRCQRDEQKKVTFRYDLTLPSKGSTSASERRYHTIVNPSSEFRRKLLDGGGAVVYANAASNDDRSRPSDSVGDRFARGTQQNGLLETVLPRSPSKTVSDGLQLSKPKLGSSSSSVGGGGGGDTKKHKSKSSQDDNVMKPSSTFANLFGTPITKVSNSKQSPEQKISNNSGSTSSNNTKLLSSSNAGGGSTSAAISASSGNSNKQISQKTSASSSSKDKSDKSSKSKKEKNKVGSSPMKDGKELTSSKKGSATSSAVDDKHQRREDIRKEKSHNKDRERSKDKPSKRPVSPKALAASRSPKRSASPSSRNNSSNRHLTDVPSSATQSILSARHIDEKASSSSSTNKKSKKDKRDKSFEKERDRGVDAKKDGKSMPTSSKLPKDEKPLSKSLEKINGTSKKDRDGGGGSGNSTPKDSIRDKSSSSNNAKYRQVFDGKIDSPAEILQKNSAASCGLERENKKVDKHDGSDRKHKHKKKDKKEKGRSGSKDRKKDKEKVSKAGVKEMIDDNPTSLSTNHKRSYGQTPPLQSTHSASSVKAATSSASLMSTATMHSKLSDDSSSDFDMDDDYPTTTRPSSPPPVKHEKPDVVDSITSEHSSMIGLPDVVTKVSPSHRATLGESPTKQTKKSGKESKSKSLIAAAAAASKEEFQGKRRGCKHSSSSGKRKTQSPATIEPPMKMVKKEQIKSESNREILNSESIPDGKYVKTDSYFPSRSEQHQHQQHQQQQQSILNQHQQQIQSDSITSNSSISLPNLSTDSSFRSPGEPTPVDYLSQLRTLQQKIMALQDNSELQQVVEMIAATGCYEITSRTFDFDLCALDRTTVQRLQDFFSQSQSAVIK